MDGREYARNLQEKFELYALALIFTILGLAIQTADLGKETVADWIEVAGWVSLLIAGLAGMSRFEHLPIIHKNIPVIDDVRAEINRLSDAQRSGETLVVVAGDPRPTDIGPVIEGRKRIVEQQTAILKRMEASNFRKYAITRWLFVVGLVLLLVSRAYPLLGPTTADLLANLCAAPA